GFQILEEDTVGCAGLETPLHYALAVFAEDAAVGESSLEDRQELHCIEPRSLGEEQALGHGADRHGDDHLIDELGDLTGPCWTDAVRSSESLEKRAGKLESVGVGANHDREGSLLGAHGAAGYGRIHVPDA